MNKNICLSLVFLLLAGLMLPAFTTTTMATDGAKGPKTKNLLCSIYANPDVENLALETGQVDVIDWPLTKSWIDKWSTNPNIKMREYSEFGMMEFDLNHQKWPTGCEDHVFYNSTCVRCLAAKYFRKAIACLTDKDRIISDILKGYGYRMDTILPFPTFSYCNFTAMEEKGLIYDYDTARAMVMLTAGGFGNWDGDNVIEWSPDNGSTWEELPSLKIFTRMDDPNRKTAGDWLIYELNNLPGGLRIANTPTITEKTVCWYNAMVIYDYHIYTGGWSLSPLIDSFHDLYHSYFYVDWGAPAVGWAPNYPGFCNHEYDPWAEAVKYASTEAELRTAAQKCCEIFAENVAMIPLWCMAAVKAFATGWEGVVNNAGYGVDNYWSFLSMHKTGATTITYGFKSNIEDIHPVCSEWLWDWNVIGLIYESLMGYDPFSQQFTAHWIADDHYVTTWASGTKTIMYFHVRSGAVWQDNTPVDADDVTFTLDFTKRCGAGVAWNFASIRDMNACRVMPIGDNPPTKTNTDGRWVEVKENVKSLFALNWIGGLPILPEHIWETIKFPTWNTSEWEPANPVTGVRAYSAWKYQHPTNTSLTQAIGTGAWILPWDSGLGTGACKPNEYVRLMANDRHYKTQQQVENEIGEMFHGFGNVNYAAASNTYTIKDSEISLLDVGYIARAWATNSTMSGGTGWDEWNIDADFNKDNNVDDFDYLVVHKNYGKKAG